MNANFWNRSRGTLCLIWCFGVGANAASAVNLPDYIGFVSHHNGLPNPDRPYEMISGTVHYLPNSLFSLYDLEFQPSNPSQLDIPNRDEEGNYAFDSQFDITYRAMVSFGLEPVHPISGFGKAHAVGRAAGGQWPFEPLVYDTELVKLELFGLSPIPEAMIRESPSLQSKGVTIVEDLCPVCASPLSTLRISSFFDIFTEVTLSGGQWAEADKAIRVAQYPAPTTPGDYNSNGVVDAADYGAWRDNLGGDFSLPNDDTPGVDDYDYTRWRENFGEVVEPGAGQLAAVPEPASLGLFMLGLWCLFVWARGERES